MTKKRNRKPDRKRSSIEVVDQPDGSRFVVTTFPNGDVVKKLVEANAKPVRRPRKPIARANVDRFGKSRKKRY
jgi:hypothetical protein